jgi:hypothetical protein
MNGIFGGSVSSNVPGRSPEEQRLYGLQAESLSRSSKLQDLLMPYQLKQMGLTPTMGANGEITGITEGPQAQRMNDLQGKYNDFAATQLESQMKSAPQSAQIQDLYNQRTLAALKGELPVNPALTRELGESERDLRNSLQSQLGTGYATSSPGIEALTKFGQRKSETLEGARRGDLSLSEQMSLGRTSSNFGTGVSSSDLSSRLRGMSLQEMMGLPSGYQGASNAMNPVLGRESDMRAFTGGLQVKAGLGNQQYGLDLYKQMGQDAMKAFGWGK